MIILGYPGEIDKESTSLLSNRAFWGLLSTIPFVYILVVVIKSLKVAISQTSKEVGVLLRNAGLLTLFTWGFYPIAFMVPFYGLSGGGAEATLQIGYSIADITAKCGYGLLIYHIAKMRTEEENLPTTVPS
jgi:bacteriorhodopsin